MVAGFIQKQQLWRRISVQHAGQGGFQAFATAQGTAGAGDFLGIQSQLRQTHAQVALAAFAVDGLYLFQHGLLWIQIGQALIQVNMLWHYFAVTSEGFQLTCNDLEQRGFSAAVRTYDSYSLLAA